MIDVGANLSNSQFDPDLHLVIERAVGAGLTAIILTSTNTETFHANTDIIQKYKDKIQLYTTLGLHPHHASEHLEFFKFYDTIHHPSVVAIGEFGLDYHRMLSPKDVQLRVMNEFLTRARHTDKPLFLHERAASSDFLSVLQEHNLSNSHIVHCFTGNRELMTRYLDLGYYIGITSWCSDMKRGKDLRDALAYLPLDRMLIETDCPYLSPHNMNPRVRRHEPAFMTYLIESIAEVKQISQSEVISRSRDNTMRIFQLPEVHPVMGTDSSRKFNR